MFGNCYVLVVSALIGCGVYYWLLALVRFYLLVWFVCIWQLWVLSLVCWVCCLLCFCGWLLVLWWLLLVVDFIGLFVIDRLRVNSVVICVRFCIRFLVVCLGSLFSVSVLCYMVRWLVLLF